MSLHGHSMSGKAGASRFLGLCASALFVATLAACGGGNDGAPGAQGPAGPPGIPGTPGQNAGDKIDLATLTPEQWAASKFVVAVSKVTVASAPVVEFTIKDSTGKPVNGLDKFTSKSATATVASYPNISFALAKYVAGVNSSPSRWVSYIVTTVPTTTTAAAATRPTTDNTGTLVATGDGAYRYTFYRDVTAIKSQIDALTFTGNNVKADLDDLTWEPTLPHRLTIQFSGAARGTGSNTADAVTTTAAVNLESPVNAIYNFVPSTGAAIANADLKRQLVSVDNCNQCHEKLAFHGGNRIDTEYCVVCHTSQRGYGYANTASTNAKFPALKETASVNSITGITSYSYSRVDGVANSYKYDGVAVGQMPQMIHKIHNGKELVKDNYNYANVVFNNKGYSMLGGGQKMCTVCHDSAKAVNANDYLKPTRAGCSSCHDGINFATGGGSTLADKAAVVYSTDVLATSGHAPGVNLVQTDDVACSICHTPDNIKVYHRTENKTTHNPVVAPGLANFTYEIKSAAVNATTNDLTIEFRILKDGSAVSLVPAAASVSNPLTGFTGSPSFLLAFAASQDGITTPADYNNLGNGQAAAQPRSVSIAALLSTNNAANGALTASSTAGYYVATIKGSGAWAMPAGAKMRAVALQGYFTQAADASLGLPATARHTVSVIKAVTGDAARRTVVDSAKCANCHEWFEGHGGNRVYEVQVCATCHVPGLTSSGRGIADATLATWNFDIASTKIVTDWGFNKTATNAALAFPAVTNNLKDMIHGIHAGRERVSPFQTARDRTPSVIQLLDFRRMDFPGVLSNCTGCHVTSTSATTTFNTVPVNSLLSTYESVNAAYLATPSPANAKASRTSANVSDKVTTPFTASCVSCHDAPPAKSHMTLNGGLIESARSAAVGVVEACAVCHGPGKGHDAAVVHK